MRAHQILFVEDDLLLSFSACEFIRDRGIRVVEASDAMSAIELIEKHGYISGLVSDIDLGLGQDGFEVARRARAVYPDLPVVFVSGAAATRHELEGVEGSIFINKPYHPRQITDAIVALSAAARARKASSAPTTFRPQMLTSAECIDRAVELEGRSFTSTDEKARENLASMGRAWRHIALQADWQDAFVLRHSEHPARQAGVSAVRDALIDD
jgi:DNA-binding response OmpR family regulator